MFDFTPRQLASVRSNKFWESGAEFPGFTRVYVADPRFPVSVAVPSGSKTEYEFWDEDALAVQVEVRGDGTLTVSQINLARMPDRLAQEVRAGRRNVIDYVRSQEESIRDEISGLRFKIRRNAIMVNGTPVSVVDIEDGTRRAFFLSSDNVIWNIIGRELADHVYQRIADSFRFIQVSAIREALRQAGG
ncbi:hypothetical protein FDA94_13715 [Herbidospora galbida]|uniref:Uncharacterized protein n=1 Tax=Herbidospora galbida TaxID=2575442 RepID=A0A4U3MK28_9ACTN|nr:hypothetical protein [Herbidospora galbida]TKK88356.1 hypothetical protein FDA94_13715 [Herbidospora galbida]